ncbi:unnamed protein product [Closterium sp. Yama58-4]|nr:unnamed protein product [Closterium sp. Yama58-4]
MNSLRYLPTCIESKPFCRRYYPLTRAPAAVTDRGGASPSRPDACAATPEAPANSAVGSAVSAAASAALGGAQTAYGPVPSHVRATCALCARTAAVRCAADRADLCVDCDAAVHSSNCIFIRHARFVLCARCAAPTNCLWPPAAAGANHALPPRVVCGACLPLPPDETLPKRQKFDASAALLPPGLAGSSGLNDILFHPFSVQQQKQKQEVTQPPLLTVPNCFSAGPGSLTTVTRSQIEAAFPLLNALSRSNDNLSPDLPPLPNSASCSSLTGASPPRPPTPRTLQLFPVTAESAAAESGGQAQCGGKTSPPSTCSGFSSQPQAAVAERGAADTRSPLRLLADVAGANAADAGAAEAVELPTLPELALRLTVALTPAEAAPAGPSGKGLGFHLTDSFADASEITTNITLLGKRKFERKGDPKIEAGEKQPPSLPSMVPPFIQSASVISPPPPVLVESPPPAAPAAATAVKSSAGAAMISAAGAAEQADGYFHLSPRSNLRHQVADRLRRILCSWCAKLALRGQRVVDLALHVLQRALKDLPLGSVDSNALRVLLAACLWTAAKLDGGRQKDVPNAAVMSAVSLVEVSVLQAAELQLMKMMNWKPLEGFEA